MKNLFSPEWMQAYQAQWNQDVELKDALAQIHFDSNIGYGFKNDPHPRGVIIVKNGEVVAAEPYNNQPLNWDLRADEKDWQQWLKRGIKMMGLSAAYLQGKIKFAVGDYTAMIKDPRMVKPFLKTFVVMGQVNSFSSL
ncbi:MAG: SCP-2 sterol transfer family protein [Spirulinaceae cyanobacterium]